MKQLFFWTLTYFALMLATSFDPLVLAIASLSFAALLTAVCARQKLLIRPAFSARRAVPALPLLSFAALNLVFFDKPPAVAYLVTVIAGAVCEELIFRGLLTRALSTPPLATAVISAGVFALYHLVCGGGCLTAVCALCIGFALCGYYIRTKSLITCIAVHVITNITGAFGSPRQLLPVLICCSILVCCGLWNIKRTKEN